jgi:hypothetical protein
LSPPVLPPAGRQPNKDNGKVIFDKDDERLMTGSRGAIPVQKSESLFEAANKGADRFSSRIQVLSRFRPGSSELPNWPLAYETEHSVRR